MSVGPPPQNFLNACGARVSGAGSSAVSIEGGQDLHGCTYRVMPDRIAAATYLCAAASAGGDIYLRGAEEGHLSTVTAALREAGCTVTADSGGIRALCRERLRAVGPVQTAPYPGFPTDAQAVLMAALLRSRGKSDTSIANALQKEGYTTSEIAKILQQMNQ